MMSQGANNSGRSKKARWLYGILFGVLGTFGLGIVVFFATCLFGFISGEEFSPDTFSRRSFYYYQIPLIQLQVWPIDRKDTTSDLENYLRTKKYVPVKKTGELHWDLVYTARAQMVIAQGDAAILCSYLDIKNQDGDFYWKKWTEDHPKAAAILWPEIARVASQQLYIFTPDMLELARGVSDPDTFERKLNRMLARKYSDLARTQQQLELHETAVELLDEALTYAPDDEELAKRRAESQQATGGASEDPGTQPDE